MIRKRSKCATYQYLDTYFNNGNEKASTKQFLADTFASTFSLNFSIRHFSEEFQKYKKQQEKTKLN